MSGLADFTTAIAGFRSPGTSTVDGGVSGGSLVGGSPVATAVFVSRPASTSAWVTTYGAVQVTDAPGASEAAAAGHVITGAVPVPENDTSSTPTSVIVTLPVLVMRNEYVIVCPAALIRVRSAVFATVRAGDPSEGTSTVEGGETGGCPDGGVPVPVAVFVTPPASMSACVTTYGAVHVTSAPGARDSAPAGQVTTGAVPVPVNETSSTPTSVSVTLPVFVRRNEYVIVWPAAVISVRSAVFATVSAGAGSPGTRTVDGGDTGGSPEGGVPVTVAVFVTPPPSRSACVTTYGAVQVTWAPGARDAAPAGHVTTGAVPVPVKPVSSTVTSAIVTLPVLVTRKEYVIV